MGTRVPVVAGNWKLHKTVREACETAVEVRRLCERLRDIEVVVAPPFTALWAVAQKLDESRIGLAAQDVFWESKGAFTGEVSAAMLADAGCQWVIIGHSERRQFFGETDETVARKTVAALAAGLRPIVCVGESLAERDAGQWREVVSRQVRRAFEKVAPADAARCVIAYEPVWAIGTGRAASAQQAQEVHRAIRGVFAEVAGDAAADALRIQYGGSVKPENAGSFFAEPDIDGMLVGGASLEADSFARIVKARG